MFPARLTVLWAAFAALASGAGAQNAPSRPVGVTDSAIVRGREVFRSYTCSTCHGPEGRGTTQGPNLTDGIWVTGNGTYEEIIRQIVHGERPGSRSNAVPMPMRGWEPITEPDVWAVAAYVWSLSRADHGAGRP